jgi:hypothetical protein
MGESSFDDFVQVEENITKALEPLDLGLVDGNDVGQGEFTIFLFGPDARALLDHVEQILPPYLLLPGARAVLRRDVYTLGPFETRQLEIACPGYPHGIPTPSILFTDSAGRVWLRDGHGQPD